jgi:hypothetical protein
LLLKVIALTSLINVIASICYRFWGKWLLKAEVGIRNLFFSPQSQFRNLKEALPQFSAYFWQWSSLKLDILLPQGIFCY